MSTLKSRYKLTSDRAAIMNSIPFIFLFSLLCKCHANGCAMAFIHWYSVAAAVILLRILESWTSAAFFFYCLLLQLLLSMDPWSQWHARSQGNFHIRILGEECQIKELFDVAMQTLLNITLYIKCVFQSVKVIEGSTDIPRLLFRQHCRRQLLS
jgi:hypothetical protein